MRESGKFEEVGRPEPRVVVFSHLADADDMITASDLFLGGLPVVSALVEDEVGYFAFVVLKELHFRIDNFQKEFRF